MANKLANKSKSLFFNLTDDNQGIKRDLGPGLHARIFPGTNLMLSIVEIEPNCAGELHSHSQEQWGILVKGSGIRDQNGQKHRVSVGDFWQTPGDMPHSFTAGPDGATVIDIFSPPRDEYKESGSGFGA